MRWSDAGARNWGLLVALLLGAVILPVLFGGLMMAGGGCEGRPAPCEGDYTGAWLILAGVVGALVLLGWTLNRLVALLARGD